MLLTRTPVNMGQPFDKKLSLIEMQEIHAQGLSSGEAQGPPSKQRLETFIFHLLGLDVEKFERNHE